MVKWMLFLTALGVFILSFEWPLPRTYFENSVILLGYVLMFGPGFLALVLILNRLVNISFNSNSRRKR